VTAAPVAGSASPGRARPRVWLAAYLVAVLASRLPLLASGYGSDDDSWRNMVAAVRMRELGHYVPSRVPGFPVFERMLAALAPWGWGATNAAAILAGAVAAVVFFRLAVRLQVRAPRWLALGFAFGGGMWVATAQTMDYAFGIALLLGAYLALLAGRRAGAGVLLALAAGCRVSNGALLVSAVLFLAGRRVGLRGWVAFFAAFTVTAAIVFAPVALSPEIGDLRAHAARHAARAHVTLHSLVPVLRQALVFCFGKTGTVALALGLLGALVASLRGRRPAPGGARSLGPELAFEGSAVVLVGALFLLVPYESAYLLPALPFVLLLLARVLWPYWIAGSALLMAAECIAQPIIAEHHVVPGRLFMELARRRADLAETRALAALEPGAPTVYVVGRFRIHRLLLLEPRLQRLPPAWAPFQGPGLALRRPEGTVGYAATLTPEQADSLRSAGCSVAIWPREEASGP
jgi:hypothetical protein